MRKRLSEMDKQVIEKKAVEILTQFGYDHDKDTYIDTVKLAVSMGFKVGESNKLSIVEDGFISISKDKKDLVIGVNTNRPFEEKRFIVAHELGHYILHYLDSNLAEAVMHREHIKGKNMDENDADYFAACILMPRNSFKRCYEELKRKKYNLEDILDYLQLMFYVPRESVQRRIGEVCR